MIVEGQWEVFLFSNTKTTNNSHLDGTEAHCKQ